VFALGEDGQVHFAEAGALTPEDLAAVQQQVRARVMRWFAPSALPCSPHPQGPTHLSSRSKWQLSGLEFKLLNVAKWPHPAVSDGPAGHLGRTYVQDGKTR
jgi:hypothetical protein